jgi:hypothetical protein
VSAVQVWSSPPDGGAANSGTELVGDDVRDFSPRLLGLADVGLARGDRQPTVRPVAPHSLARHAATVEILKPFKF